MDNLEAEVARLKAKGVKLRNEAMEFHSRKLVFLCGPEGVIVELGMALNPRAVPSPEWSKKMVMSFPTVCLYYFLAIVF